MSANDQLIEVRAGFSVRHLLFFIFLSFFALLAVWLSGTPWFVKLIASLILSVCSRHYYSAEICKKHYRAITSVRYHKGVWHAFYGNGWHRVWLKGERLVLPELMSLGFVDEKGKGGLRINLFADSDSSESMHALRLRLLLEREQKKGSQMTASKYQ
ncbi:hypothetical protein EOPP23_18045 [Endozoicomonas sp. OPT23]|nr:hypothetical protein [Endozoicomonas sp. OPT23]